MRKNLLKTLGPGILFASTAIGVSHLIQSTQAGANFGFTMLIFVILANIFKYPFFEFGSRYANATGKSIISGYKDLGNWVLYLYFIITIFSMFLVTAAVGYGTSAFMQELFGLEDTLVTVGIVFVVCIALLITDNFAMLDGLIKVIGIVLLISTITAFVLVLINGVQGSQPLMSFENINRKDYITFLIPLMGWMPTAVDLSAWNSLWTIERIRQTNYHPELKETLFDFNLGYVLSSLLAICFITLGAFIMFGTGHSFSDSPAAFSADVINLYTNTFGNWAYWIIAISAFSIMFGTCVAVFDGYSRAMSTTIRLMQGKPEHAENEKNEKQVKMLYRIVLVIVSIGAFILIYLFLPTPENPKAFKKMVNLATSVSFILAPAIAIFNLILVSKKHVGKEYVPPLWIKITAWLGIVFLSAFTFFYIFQEHFLTN